MKCCTLLLLALFLLTAGSAHALAVEFGDNSTIWPGYTTTPGSDKDVHGIPDLLGGQLQLTNNNLMSIRLDYTRNEFTTNSFWNTNVGFGDWFFDTNNDGYWDYVVHNTNYRANGPASDQWVIYSLSTQIPITDTDFTYYWESNDLYKNMLNLSGIPRQGHPVGLKGVESIDVVQIGTASYTGLVPASGISVGGSGSTLWTLHYDNSADGIFLDGYFTMGFTLTCANDVIFEQLHAVPEPGTFVLLGIGLGILGLLVMHRRR